MDIENFVRKCISRSLDESFIVDRLSSIIRFYKDLDEDSSEVLSRAVFDEVSSTVGLEDNDLLNCPVSGVHMGEFGVGSRGQGDFYVHSRIAEIVGDCDVDSVVSPTSQDDGGVVRIDEDSFFVTTAIDGIHSRLSDYPFLAGFHTARATLRDVCVMGSRPVGLISDIHLADDGDVAKLLDFTAGVCAVCELTGVPLLSGSTLRVGGDMVLGDRLVGGVGCVGTSSLLPTARGAARAGDVIVLTEGSGGGTISTTAIYNSFLDVIDETLNVQFIRACEVLRDFEDIHAMTDVTNGGIVGDVFEISRSTGLGICLVEEAVLDLINPKVYDMLSSLDIDPLGVSIDSLMLILPEDLADEVVSLLEDNGVRAARVGFVDDSGRTTIRGCDGVLRELVPKFRESAYTPVKKVVDSLYDVDWDESVSRIDRVTAEVIDKKDNVVRWVRGRYE